MEILYHYCPTESFYGIAKTKELWLSSLSLANDTMEGKLVARAMSQLAGRHFDRHDVEALTDEILDLLNKVDGLGFCFSKERDLLSQWRGYASNATGIAIGFSKDYLERMSETLEDSQGRTIFELREVEYDHDQHEQLVTNNFTRISPYIHEGAFRTPMVTLLQSNAEYVEKLILVEEARKKLKSHLALLVDILYFLKDQAFKEEKEVRLFSHLFKFIDDPYEHRVANNRIIPYRSFPLNAIKHPILEVILGPKHETPPEIIYDFLRKQGFGEVTIVRSTATYR